MRGTVGMTPFAALRLSVVLVALTGCGEGNLPDISTKAASADSHYVWSADSPRIELEFRGVGAIEGDDESSAVPWWNTLLPLGPEGTIRPGVSVMALASGELVEDSVLIEFGETSEKRKLEPYPDHPGYFVIAPVEIDFGVPTETGHRWDRSITIDPLIRLRDRSIQFRYKNAEVRVAAFPGSETPFLIFDGNGDGLYSERDVLVIDHNGDGRFDGNRNSVERYSLHEPFLLNGEPFELSGASEDGAEVRWRRSDAKLEPRAALLAGDVAPDFELENLAGETVRFSAARAGRPTLLSYWATW